MNDIDDEKIVNLLKERKSMKYISNAIGRSEDYTKLTLQKIIYANIKFNKIRIEDLCGILNMSFDEIDNNYKAYKEFLAKNTNVSQIDIITNDIEQKNEFMGLILQKKKLFIKLNEIIDKYKMDKQKTLRDISAIIKDYVVEDYDSSNMEKCIKKMQKEIRLLGALISNINIKYELRKNIDKPLLDKITKIIHDI